MDINHRSEARPRSRLGLPFWQIAGLAALAMPRAFVHDAGIATLGPAQALLVFGPPLVWLVVAVVRRVPSPIVTLLAVGGLYGVGLAIVHNLFWSDVFSEHPPELGGNLAGALAPGTEEFVLRAAASVSSLFTGIMVGLICGLLAVAARRANRRSE